MGTERVKNCFFFPLFISFVSSRRAGMERVKNSSWFAYAAHVCTPTKAICICMYACMYVCMYVCMCMYVYICIYIHAHVSTCVFVCVCVCVCVCVHIYIHIYTYIDTPGTPHNAREQILVREHM